MIGTRLGPYDITAKLGEGGMGEVWRAHDSQLGREVALKVLPEAFTADPERTARFEREAKLLASLNHPNIAQIYGFEASGETRALVMELVEGPTLAERLEAGSLPSEESLSIARQIAEALEEAHEKGIIHRDLKPQNIKASIEGKVKVLDFGLAKAMDPVSTASGGQSASQLAASPTLTLGATVQGMILGTAAYMAPEQAKGFTVDKRADIWAFGVVLYEMLTGRALFAGDSVPDTLARVLQREIDFDALPESTPPAIRRLLRRCLERQPKRRLRDIGDARLVLDDVAAGRDGGTLFESTVTAAIAPRFAWLPWSTAGVLATALVLTLAAAISGWFGGKASPSRPLLRASILLPDSEGVALQGTATFAVSPDGSAIVFTVFDEAGAKLFLRELAETESRELVGTEGAGLPFWSPDSRQIAFFAQGALRRVPRAAGAVQTICPAQDARGGSWGNNGTIVFAQGHRGPLYRVPASGGSATPATQLDEEAEDTSHRFPVFLPDGRHFLFGSSPWDDAGRIPIKVASLDEVSRGRLLLAANSVPRFAPPGELVFRHDAALVAQRIDLDRLEMVGESRQLAERPGHGGGYTGAPAVEVSNDGKMIYPPREDRPSQLVVLDRSGNRLEGGRRLGGEFYHLGLSHRGDRFASRRREADETLSLWIFDVTGGDGVRISPPGRDVNSAPLWSPDDREILVQMATGAGGSGYVATRLAIDSGEVRPLRPTPSDRWEYPVAWSRDGAIAVFSTQTEGQKFDITYYALDDESERRTYLATPASEEASAISPDGRWLAYLSDASGRPEAYIDSFPNPSGARRIATGGLALGMEFRADGGELIIGTLDGDHVAIYSSELRLGESIEVGRPRQLFSHAAESRSGFALSRDRFFVLEPVGRRVPTLTLVDNWQRQLEPRR